MQQSLYSPIYNEDEFIRKSTLDFQVGNLQSQINSLPPSTYLISGNASWSGVGFVYNVSATQYKIAGVLYNTSPTQVTLAPSNPKFDRIDVIAVDNTGSVIVLTGIPSACPVKPQTNSTQIELTFITVKAGAKIPNIPLENIYIDNNEWTGTTNGNVNFDSNVLVYQGTKSVQTVTNLISNQYIQFSKGSPYVISGGNLTFWIKLNNNGTVPGSIINIQFWNAGSPVGNIVSILGGPGNYYGVIGSDTTSWQLCTIPISAFGNITTVDALRFFKGPGPSSISNFFIDFIKIESTIPTPTNGHVIMDEGIALPQRTNLDFKGDIVLVTDDSLNDKTIVNIHTPYRKSFWIYNVSGASNYPWNGVNVGNISKIVSSTSHPHLLASFSGVTNQYQGFYFNDVLPSTYKPGANLKMTAYVITNAGGGNVVFWGGLTQPTSGNILGGFSETEWIKQTVAGQPGFTIIPTVFVFNGATLNPNDVLLLRIYRDPNDPADTLGTTYIVMVQIEEV
jgi:hypothetical protein